MRDLILLDFVNFGWEYDEMLETLEIYSNDFVGEISLQMKFSGVIQEDTVVIDDIRILRFKLDEYRRIEIAEFDNDTRGIFLFYTTVEPPKENYSRIADMKGWVK